MYEWHYMILDALVDNSVCVNDKYECGGCKYIVISMWKQFCKNQFDELLF